MKSISKGLVKSPSSVFKSCPSCDSPNLTQCDSDVICIYCGWDSIALQIEAFFSARRYEEGVENEDLRVRDSQTTSECPRRGYVSAF